MFRSLLKNTIKVVAKGRAVAIGRDANAPIITGDIHAPVSIDQRSFEQDAFLSKASAFESCDFKVPLLWTARQCLKMLSPSRKHQEKLAFKFIQNKVSYMTLVLNNNSANVKILYYKNSNEEIDKDDLKSIATELLNHSNNLSSIQLIVNKALSKNVEKYIKKALTGNFSSKFFNKNQDSFTGIEIPFLNKIFANIEIVGLEEHYNDSDFSPYISSDRLGNVSELTKALAIKLLSESASKELVIIKCHDLEVRFGAEHYGEIFPAPPKFDSLLPNRLRNQQESILNSIISKKKNSIIHASGGVGKTVMARLANTVIPLHSCSIVYDCFGDGLYRSLNSPRHSIDKLLVQIVNELAIIGLCEPLIATSNNKSRLMQEFTSCIEASINLLKKRHEQANLYIFIDAADNAEMAAKERAENTIVSELLNDLIIEGCTIVALCRTERVVLLNPRQEIQQFKLSSFTESESFDHLKSHFPKATIEHGKEFHRLSGGNPRVQAYAISDFPKYLNEMLGNLGPTLSTVDEQIEVQLSKAIIRLKSKNVKSEANKIDLICTALASLPPFIPINVISKLTKFSISEISSFISDFGRGLMLIDNNIQFRDEPTETWFRKMYASNSQQAKEFVVNISPLANTDSYVSECLPYLMLAGENYEDLINLALSENFLPIENPIDARSIRTSRLNAAIKSALRIKDYLAVIKLAMRTGEEFAGDQRQIELLNDNVALICMIQSPSEIQKLAFQGKLRSGWKGSENLYKASLLSVHEEYKGESLGYLRSAENWLDTYFKKREEVKEKHFRETLNDKDIAELFFVYFNHFGADRTIKRILRWTPAEAMHSAINLFSQKLIDTSNFDAIEELAQASKEFSYISIHFISSLFSMQGILEKEILESSLADLLTETKDHKEAKHKIPLTKLLLFFECCIKTGIDKNELPPVMEEYVKIKPQIHFTNTRYGNEECSDFIGLYVLTSNIYDKNFNEEEFIPCELLTDDKNHKQKEDEVNYRKMLRVRTPLCFLLTKLRTSHVSNFLVDYKTALEQVNKHITPSYHQEDSLDNYVNNLKLKCILWAQGITPNKQKELLTEIIHNCSYGDLLYGLFITARIPQLSSLACVFEGELYNKISSFKGDGPESMSRSLIDLATAISPLSKSSSSRYFDQAVEAVSRFGNEALCRHMALLTLAERSSNDDCSTELTYRFSRGTEIIYEYMSDHFPLERTIRAIHDMNAPTAFAVMARWFDREVTYAGAIEGALFEQSLNSCSLSAEASWCATGFIENKSNSGYLSTCMKKSKSDHNRAIIFTDAINQALIQNTSITTLIEIQNIGTIYNLSSQKLDHGLADLQQQENLKTPKKTSSLNIENNKIEIDWNKVFTAPNIIDSKEIEKALSNFYNIKNKSYQDNFWQQLYSRTSVISAIDMIEAILNCKFTSEYELQSALENTPQEWFLRDGVRDIWYKGFDIFVQNNISTVINPYWPKQCTSKFNIKEDFSKLIVPGVLKGLESKTNFNDAEFLFSIVSILTKKISEKDAQAALEYALERLELHIESTDADGDWDLWLTPPNSSCDAYASFIWSVLANPTSEIRWQAVHIVYRLVQLGCDDVINSIVNIFKKDNLGAFGSNQFPFYKCHAQLYFLIGISRGANDEASTLLKQSAFFLEQALHSEHALLEHFSSIIALKLLDYDSNIFNTSEIESLKSINKSKYAKSTLENRNESIKADIATINDDLPQLSFFLDFQEYWLKPLANVFNVSLKELKESAVSIVIDEWGILPKDNFIEDSRSNMWRNSYKERHSRHFDIPDTQPYDFYLGYHVIFTMASRLFKKIPIVKGKHDWEDDRWIDWLSRYTLSMDDGYFLADIRDPAPFVRKSWITEKQSESWKWDVSKNDFLDGLLRKKNDETFLCVTGSWSDNDGYGNEEEYSICSALASSDKYESLINALLTCNDPYDYKLPNFDENEFEITLKGLKLKGWLTYTDKSKGLDESDPYCGDIKFPTRTVSLVHQKLLGVRYDFHNRNYLDIQNNIHGFSEIWTEKIEKRNNSDQLIRDGERVYISLDTLKLLCEKSQLSLIFKVKINRRSRTYDRDLPYEIKYPGPYCNVYCLSENGTICDQSESYQLR